MNPFESENNPELGNRAPLIFEHASKEQIEQAERELKQQAEEQKKIEQKIKQRIDAARGKTEPPQPSST